MTNKLQHILLAATLLIACAITSATPQDSTKTIYENKTFHTYCQVLAHCSNATADEVVDELIAEFRGDPELLFQWAFKGAGKQNDSEKDEILLILKETTFNKETGVGCIVTDIAVPGFRTFKDIHIESNVSKTRHDDGFTEVFVDIYYSNAVLKKAYGYYRIIPQTDGTQLLTLDVYVKFGWFFDLFITQRKYRNTIEWRAAKFMDNMRTESQRREALKAN